MLRLLARLAEAGGEAGPAFSEVGLDRLAMRKDRRLVEPTNNQLQRPSATQQSYADKA